MYRKEILESLSKLKPNLRVEFTDNDRLFVELFIKKGPAINVIGTLGAKKIEGSKNYEVKSVAAYPGTGQAIYAFAMMAAKGAGVYLMSDREGDSHENAVAVWEKISKWESVKAVGCNKVESTEDMIEFLIDEEIQLNGIGYDEYDNLVEKDALNTLQKRHFLMQGYNCPKDKMYAEFVTNFKEARLSDVELFAVSKITGDFFSSAYEFRDEIDPSDKESVYYPIYDLMNGEDLEVDLVPADEEDEQTWDYSAQAEALAKNRNIGITRDREPYMFAIHEDKVVGCAWSSFDGDNFEFDVVVSEECAGKGIGSKLTDEMISARSWMTEGSENSSMNIHVVSPQMQAMLERRDFVVQTRITPSECIMMPREDYEADLALLQ